MLYNYAVCWNAEGTTYNMLLYANMKLSKETRHEIIYKSLIPTLAHFTRSVK